MQAATASRGRTILTLFAMAIGVSSVILLISLGDSGRRYVIDQFASLGTNLLIVIPGRSETTGGPPPLLGETPRDLTLDDAIALTNSSAIKFVAPIIAGSAPVSVKQLEREMIILGSSADLFGVRRLTMGQGTFLPPGDLDRGGNVCVIGSRLRIGDRRFRVIGVLADTGVSLGEDMGEVVIIPVATAQSLFNRVSLFRIVVEAISEDAVGRAKEAILTIIRSRHEGEDDITVITQDAVLATFDRIFRALTMTVGGIAAISLVVAGIMIMNIMLVAVSNRRSEIGLLKALGAHPRQIMGVFLAESALLSIVGAAIGFLLAYGSMELLAGFFPKYSLALAPWSPFIASALALGTGIVFGVMPARRAALLEPAVALSRR
jgi:putative ABC transport system permease protein